MAAAPATAPLTAAEITAFATRLATSLPEADVERVDQLKALTQLSNAASGRQVRISVAFEDSQRAAAAAAGMPKNRQGRGIATQVAMAMKTRPDQARKFLTDGRRLVDDLPVTMDALTGGRIPYVKAETVATGTEGLDPETREEVDTQLGQQPGVLEDAPIKELAGTIRCLADARDPHAASARRDTAKAGRRVTLRPARDGMAWLSQHLPIEQAVSAYAALRAEAEKQVAAGEARSVHHAMADTLITRVTGATTATGVPVAVNLIITDTALLHGGNDPARLDGSGPIPASLGRDLVLDRLEKLDQKIKTTLRRLYTHPGTGQLVAMESKARIFPKTLAAFIRMRDQYCRTPACGNRIRQTDHIEDHADGGPTSGRNGQGVCEDCNHAKQAPGWVTKVLDTGPGDHTIEITTPTGHTYQSRAPALMPPPQRPSRNRLRVDIIEGPRPVELDLAC